MKVAGFIVFLGLGWMLAFTAAVRGQHVDDLKDSLPAETDIGKLLDAKRHRLRPKLDDKNSDLLKQLMESMPKNFDPKKIDEKKIAEVLKSFPELKDPQNLEKIQDLLKQELGKNPRPETLPKESIENLEKLLQSLKLDDLAKIDPKKLDPRTLPVSPPDPPTPPGPNQLPAGNDKQLQELAQWMTKNLGDSPAARDMIKDMAKLMAEDAGPGSAADFVKEFEKEWKTVFHTNAADSFKWGDFSLNVKLPPLGTGGGDNHLSSSTESGSGNFPGAATSSGGDGSGWDALVVIGVVVIVAIVVWRQLKSDAKQPKENPLADPKAWPVDPMRVATREDVVKAFDFMSTAKCGSAAENWNHWRIAHQLEIEEPTQTQSVERLARLYEKARYAPAEEIFSVSDVAEARARLCQIAGVANA